jgi:hypothetical protein
MFDWTPDFDLSSFENRGFPANFQSHFLFRLTLLDEILIGRLDFRQFHRRWWRPLCHADGSCCRYNNNININFQIFFFFFRFAALLASVARLGFSRPGCRIAVIGRLGHHLTQGKDLLAGNFADLETSVASRRALRVKKHKIDFYLKLKGKINSIQLEQQLSFA